MNRQIFTGVGWKSFLITTIGAISLLLPFAVLAFPSTPILDNFNRADENPIAGIWTNGVFGTGACQIISNTLRLSSGTEDCYVTQTFGVTQEVYGTMPNATSHSNNTNFRFLACLQNIGATVDGYALRFQKLSAATDVFTIQRIDSGTFTTIGAATTQEIDNGDMIGLQIKSNGDISSWYNSGGGWTQIEEINDTTHTCTATNIGIDLPNTTHHVDDFGGGQPAFYIILEVK